MSVQSWSGTEPHWSASPVVSSSVPAWAGAALLLGLAQADHAGAEQSCSTCGPDLHRRMTMPNRVGLCWSPALALTRAGLCPCHTEAEPIPVPSRARCARTQSRPHPCRGEPDDDRAENTSASGCSTPVLSHARVESAHCRAGLCQCRAVSVLICAGPGWRRCRAGPFHSVAGAGASARPAVPPPLEIQSVHVVLRRGAREEGRGWAQAPCSALPNGGAAPPFPSESGPMAREGGAMSWREGWVCGHVGAEGGLKVSRALWARQSGRRG